MLRRYETKIKLKITLGLVFALILACNFKLAYADAIDDQLSASQKKLEQLNQQIKSYQQQIATTQAKAGSLKNEIFIYNNQIASTELQIQAKETQIEDVKLQITQTQNLIAQKNQEIADNKKILGQLVVELKEYDDQYALKTTVGSNNLSDFLDQIQYNQNLQDRVYQLVKKIKDLKAQLQKQEHDLEVKVRQLEEFKKQLKITRDSLTTVKNQKQQLLAQTQGLEKNYQKLLASSKQDADNLQKEIQDLDAKVRARLGNKTITGAKGVLAWPMDGILTQGYGNTGFTSLGYNFHNGIDVAGPAGQPIYAAADGNVLYTDHSNATFGNWVAVKHNITTKNGASQIITLYAHMRAFNVTIGQHLAEGDLIGYEGNTGNTTAKIYGPERGYHLHFGVYDAEGFGVNQGSYTKIYGPYLVPYGYTYNPLDFLSAN